MARWSNSSQEGMGAFPVSCYDSRSYCVPTCPICDLNGKLVEPYTQSVGLSWSTMGMSSRTPSTAACMRITWIPLVIVFGKITRQPRSRR